MDRATSLGNCQSGRRSCNSSGATSVMDRNRSHRAERNRMERINDIATKIRKLETPIMNKIIRILSATTLALISTVGLHAQTSTSKIVSAANAFLSTLDEK